MPAYDVLNSVAPRPVEIISEHFLTLRVPLPANAPAVAKGQVMGRITADGNWLACVAGATDGSQVIRGVALHASAQTAGAREVTILVFGKVAASFPVAAGYTAVQLRSQLHDAGIFLEATL